MGLREWYDRVVRKKDNFQQAQEMQQIERKLQERRLSADERELNKFLEEDRQRQVKEMLNQFRKRKQEEVWHGDTALDAPNIIANQKNLFKRKNEGNLFGWKSDNIGQGGMFFR